MLPLDHLRVLDLTRLAPGPHCTMLLADMGADVIRVEEPGGGRRAEMEHERMTEAQRTAEERAAAFNALNRNKRSIALNLKSAEAKAAFYDLARAADVVVEGFRPGVVARLGVDHATLAAINPRIISCSISGYGQSGPYKMVVGHDINYVALSGAMSMFGEKNGPPAFPSNLLGDYGGGGLHAAFAILTAVIARERTGQGQHIDIAMTEGVMMLAAAAMSISLAQGRPLLRGEHRLTGGVPQYGVYRCQDGGYISVGANEPWFFDTLMRELGGDEFAGTINGPADVQARQRAFLERTFATRSRDDWWQHFKDKDVCVAPVLTLTEAAADPHTRARGMIVDLPHPTLGAVEQIGVSAHLSETPGAVRTLPAARGEHTRDLLRSVGWSEARIEALRAEGATSWPE